MKRCRALKGDNLVWFNSYGKNDDGTAKKYSADSSSYSTDKQAVADSLKQRLSVIKTELWYDEDYGLPLFDKVTSKLELDFVVSEIIEQHEDVINIESYDSEIIGHTYKASFTVNTNVGQISLTI